MTVDTTTGGYDEVASDRALFACGAPFLGSMGGQPLNKPVVGMASGSGHGWAAARARRRLAPCLTPVS